MAALTIELEKPLAEKLHALANRTGRSESFYITEALEERLPSLGRRFSKRTPEEATRISKVIEEGRRLRKEICSTTGGISLEEIKEMVEEGRM